MSPGAVPTLAARPPPLASLEDLEACLGRPLAESERGQAERHLAAASDLLRRLTGQILSYVADDLEMHDGWGGTLLQLKQLPIVEISKVEIEGRELMRGSWRLEQETGNLWRWGGWWACRQGIGVTYSHGFEELPADVLMVICGMAARGLQQSQPGGDMRSEQLGPYRYDRGQAAGLGSIGVTGPEQELIRRLSLHRQVIQHGAF